jgi:hypothetical protein
MEECVITSMTKESMIATLCSEPKFSELFMAYLLTRNSRVEDRPAFQFTREATRAPSPSARAFRKGRRTSAYSSGYRPGNIGRDDWNDAIPREGCMGFRARARPQGRGNHDS